jgi:hypothetical protein
MGRGTHASLRLHGRHVNLSSPTRLSDREGGWGGWCGWVEGGGGNRKEWATMAALGSRQDPTSTVHQRPYM